MFSLLRLIFKIAILLSIGLLVLAYFTNPTLEEFKTEVRSRVQNHMDEMIKDPTLSAIASIGASFSDDIVKNMITQKNYYVCSVYTVEMPTGDYEYLGAFHMFFPMQNEDPIEKIMNRIKGLN